ncbi:hypothetical protein NC652_010499 [Populus alba x Populus x berolinensis]|nr:hypothetical protein NC652_010499 [Populus alba x Populus x berolinensis]
MAGFGLLSANRVLTDKDQGTRKPDSLDLQETWSWGDGGNFGVGHGSGNLGIDIGLCNGAAGGEKLSVEVKLVVVLAGLVLVQQRSYQEEKNNIHQQEDILPNWLRSQGWFPQHRKFQVCASLSSPDGINMTALIA